MNCYKCIYYRSTEEGGRCICPEDRDIDLKTGECSQEVLRELPADNRKAERDKRSAC